MPVKYLWVFSDSTGYATVKVTEGASTMNLLLLLQGFGVVWDGLRLTVRIPWGVSAYVEMQQ